MTRRCNNLSQARLNEEQFQRASQILKAIEKGYAKTPRYDPKQDPTKSHKDPNYLEKVRQLCVQAIYSIWNEKHRPTKDRAEIVEIVQDKVRELVSLGEWPREWKPPGRDTIIRRENQTADPRFYPALATPCISFKGGHYLPNPVHFDGETRRRLEEITKETIE